MAADTGSERNTPTPVKPSLKVMSARKVVVPASALSVVNAVSSFKFRLNIP